MTPEQAFGEVLWELRTARSLSQEALAERCRISRPHVSRLETGKNSPTMSMLFQLAEALQVTPAEILGNVQAKMLHGAASRSPATRKPE